MTKTRRLFTPITAFALVTCFIAFASGTARASGPWAQQSSSGPPARFGASMAFDPAISRAVLFGGCASQSSTTVTVTLTDGTTRTLSQFTWCAPGNELNDTWLWSSANGGSWQQISPTSTLPNKRWASTMAYDYKSHKVILFGGIYQTDTATAPSSSDADSCFQDETSEEGIAPVQSVYEPSTGRYHSYYCFKDTWTLTGSGSGPWQWQRLTTGTTPPARFDASMAFDKNGQPTVIGGCNRVGMIGSHEQPTVPTTWDCVEYTNVEKVTGSDCILPTLGLLCSSESTVENTDSWKLTWTGDPMSGGTPSWTQVGCIVPTSDGMCAPSEIRGAAATFNPATGKIHLFGGYYYEARHQYGGFQGATWEFDGSTWTRVLEAGKQDQWCPSLSPIEGWTSQTYVYEAGVWKVLSFGGLGRYFTTTPTCAAGAAGEPYRQQDPYYVPPPPGQTVGSIDRSSAMSTRDWNDAWLWDSSAAACQPSGNEFNCWHLVQRDSAQAAGAWNAAANPAPPAGMTARHAAVSAFDPVSGKAVLFGGMAGGTTLGDTWIYTASPGSDPCGTSC